MTDFLTYFEELKKMSDANKAVAKLYSDLGSFEQPDDLELPLFLEWFGDVVARETRKNSIDLKTLGAPRVESINGVREWALGKKAAKSAHFVNVSAPRFAFQLALRLRKPSSIEQGSTALCGAVAILYSLAKLSPAAFTKIAIDLFNSGKAKLNLLPLDPSPSVLHGFAGQHILCEVDYVLLTSLRQCSDVSSLGAPTNVVNETLTAGTMCTMLRNAQYKNVMDHTFIDAPSFVVWAAEKTLGQIIFDTNRATTVSDPSDKSQKLKSLEQACKELGAGRVVMIMGHTQIAELLKKGQDGFTSLTLNALTRTLNRHWVAVRKLGVVGTTVELRVISWGQRYQGKIKLDDFLALYEGYVSAEP